MTSSYCIEQVKTNQPLSKEHIKQLADVPLIYAIRNDDIGVFYVGQTKNLQKRSASYFNPNWCHNAQLAKYLRSNEFDLIVLELDPDDINEAEKKYINKFKGQLFNRISVPYAKWLEKPKQPWHAGSGVRCPSDYLLWFISMSAKPKDVKKQRQISDIKELVEKMDITERTVFEVNVYRTQPDAVREYLKPWFDTCRDEMLSVLELANSDSEVNHG